MITAQMARQMDDFNNAVTESLIDTARAIIAASFDKKKTCEVEIPVNVSATVRSMWNKQGFLTTRKPLSIGTWIISWA